MDRSLTRVVGFDIGGSTTRARLVVDGRTTAEARGPSASPVAAGPERAAAALSEVITDLGLDRSAPVDAVCAAAAGSGTASARSELRGLISELTGSPRVEVVDDVAVVLPASGHDIGVAVVCGTGSIVLCTDASGSTRAGGWGYLLGDEGGGYWLVRRAIRELLHRRDGARPTGPLGDALIGDGGLDGLIAAFYADPRPQAWAARAPAVLRCGDHAVAAIVADGARALAVTVGAAAGGRPLDRAPIVLAGGLVQEPVIVRALTDALGSVLPGWPVERLRAPPVAGAAALAQAAASEGRR